MEADVIKAFLDALDVVKSQIGPTYHAEALKAASAPFVFWLQDGEDCARDLSGNTELWENSYEFHCVAKNLDTLNRQSRKLRSVIEGIQGTTVNGIIYESVDVSMASPVLREVEVGLYRKVYAVKVNYQYINNEVNTNG